MVKVTQTEDSIKIVIEINRLIKRKPDIVLFQDYVKFNNPPIFFERYLCHEIDEMKSFCRIYKTEAQLFLVKKTPGIWDEMFRTFSKEELMEKRKAVNERIIATNQQRDKEAVERFERKKRAEIEREIQRETNEREKIKSAEIESIKETIKIDGTRKDTSLVDNPKEKDNDFGLENAGNLEKNNLEEIVQMPKLIEMEPKQMRSTGKINIVFSSFSKPTPKRESQEGKSLFD